MRWVDPDDYGETGFLVAMLLLVAMGLGFIACGAAQKPVHAELKLITVVVEPLQESAVVHCDGMEADFLRELAPADAEVAMGITRRHCNGILARFQDVREDQLAAARLVED